MSKYDTLKDLAGKIEWEGQDYFFDGYGFEAEQLPNGTPSDLVSLAIKATRTDAPRRVQDDFISALNVAAWGEDA